MLQMYNLCAPMICCRADIKRYFGSIISMENAVIIVSSHDTDFKNICNKKKP